MRVLITGAAGKLGSAAVDHFVAAGHDVVATDVAFQARLPVPLRLVDLKDELGVYGLFEEPGIDALLHLGNHPNPMSSMPRQRLLAENTAMTANLLFAATDLGVRRIVCVSSIQAVMAMPMRPQWWTPPAPCPFPRLPADGGFPARTGANPYAISKAHAEHLLRELCGAYDDLAGVTLRLPGLVPLSGWKPPRRPFSGRSFELAEGLSRLHTLDACRLFEAALLRSPAGHRCHFPSSCLAVAGIGPERIAREHLGHVPVEGDLRGPGGLNDLSELERELGWVPLEPTPLLWPEESEDLGAG